MTPPTPELGGNVRDMHALLDRGQLHGGCLLPHQTAGVGWLMSHPRAVLADDVGLGKTVMACAYLSALASTGQLDATRPVAALYVTEANLVDQTTTELRRFLPGMAIDTHAAYKPARKAGVWPTTYPEGPTVLVTSYSTARSRLAWLKTYKPTLLVLDEASAVKGMGAEWKAIRTLSGRAVRVVAASATPLENDPTETWAILSAARTAGLWDRQTFERDFVVWSAGHTPKKGRPIPPKPLGWTSHRLPEWHQYANRHILRRTAASAGLALPQVDRRTTYVPLTAAQADQYARWENMPGLWGHRQRESVGKATGISSGLVEAVLAQLDLMGQEKVAIYCESLSVVQRVRERLTARGTSFVSIEGSVDTAGRRQAVEAFRDDPACQVLVGSRVLEYGLNLQFCRVLFSLDASHNPAREHQREGRLRRIGSPWPVVYHWTYQPDTAQARAKGATLSRKSDVAAAGVGAG